MKKLLPIFLALLPGKSFCQLTSDSILVEEHYRTFQYYKPARPTNGGSLLFVMHGSGGSSNDMLKRTTRLEALAGKENLLVVYPDAYLHFWNECRKYSTAAANKEDINEQAFFQAMINYFQEKFNISKENVYAAGFSGGGHMAYKLGLTMPGTIKAIAAIVANMPDSASSDCAVAHKALPVLIINGTADNVNPYNGGEMFVSNSSFGVVRSSENSFGYWATLAGYTGEPKKDLLPDTDPADHKTIEKYYYSEQHKPPVVLLKVINGKHDYPGDIDVYLYAWEFFRSLK
jgi:polyhydroxybutyrate depolymerase